MTGWTGITLGDVTGIGPEVTLKALAAISGSDATRYLLIGDARWMRRINNELEIGLPLQEFNGYQEPGRFFLSNPPSEPLPEELEPGSTVAALGAVASLREAAQRCLRHELDAMVTAPVNKAAIVRAGQPFIGQTEFLSQLAATERTAMMLLGQDRQGQWLRVALVTTHLALKRVPESITPAKIELAVECAAQACRDLRLPRARIAICGLNPHAGEGGQLGDEEQTVIGPTLDALRQKQFEVVGPLSADTVFHHALRDEFDVVVAMYHDQGLTALKAVAFDTGVNWTLGLPFIRTSPDHGTAYDIAGKGIADPSSMIAAIRLAQQLSGRDRPTR